MMGADGLKYATEVALLSANWLAHKIEDSFKVLYKGENGRIAHECIFDCRNLPVTAEDIAKRLMDYGFHHLHYQPSVRNYDGRTYRV